MADDAARQISPAKRSAPSWTWSATRTDEISAISRLERRPPSARRIRLPDGAAPRQGDRLPRLRSVVWIEKQQSIVQGPLRRSRRVEADHRFGRQRYKGRDDHENVIQNVRQVLAAARAAGVRTYYTRHVTLPVELMGIAQLRMWRARQRVDRLEDVRCPFLPDAPQTQIVPELRPKEREAVLDKLALSAFAGTA
jgi:Isochorismatase family